MLENFNTFANFIEIAGYAELLNQANNDDIMEELQHQNKGYLETIIKQNEEIIRILKNGKTNNIIKD